MLEKRFTSTGRVYTAITNLQNWDKNPRLKPSETDMGRLYRQLAYLGQYKPNLVTQDGITVGGNRRLDGMRFLNENVYSWTDTKGENHTVDLRGKFDEVWITELSFGKNEDTGMFKAIIDGDMKEREYQSIEQIMLEYALSDNDPIGTYDQQAVAALAEPYQGLILAGTYKLETAQPMLLEAVIEKSHTATNESGKNTEIDPEKIKKELNLKCPKCGFDFKGDTDTIETLEEEATPDGATT